MQSSTIQIEFYYYVRFISRTKFSNNLRNVIFNRNENDRDISIIEFELCSITHSLVTKIKQRKKYV